MGDDESVFMFRYLRVYVLVLLERSGMRTQAPDQLLHLLPASW